MVHASTLGVSVMKSRFRVGCGCERNSESCDFEKADIVRPLSLPTELTIKNAIDCPVTVLYYLRGPSA